MATADFVLHSEHEKSLADDSLIAQARKAIQHDEKGQIDVPALFEFLMPKLRLMEPIPGTNFAASWTHILGGYQSQYYGYLWSSVYSNDLFSEFEKHGHMNPEIGKNYRDKILAPGGAKTANTVIRDFLGREPNNEAFLKAIGLG